MASGSVQMTPGGPVGNTTGPGAEIEDLEFGKVRQLADGSYAEMHNSNAAVWNYKSLTASGNTLVKTGAGQLYGFFCGTATGNITLYDNTAASGTVILAACALVAGFNPLPVSFATGLEATLSSTGVVTFLFL